MVTTQPPSPRSAPHRPIRLVPDCEVLRLPRRGVDGSAGDATVPVGAREEGAT